MLLTFHVVTDLIRCIREFEAGGYPVVDVRDADCPCGSFKFQVRVDDEEGCAQRTCAKCGTETYMLDRAEYAEEAELEDCECPCGGDTFTVAVGFARREDGEVRWVSIGLHCAEDGAVGVYADWKIDYAPTEQLLSQV